MSVKIDLSEKLKNIIFIEIKNRSILASVLKPDSNFIKYLDANKQELFLPIDTKFITNKINSTKDFNNIPFSEIFYAMFYCISLNEEFKYNYLYKKLIEESNDGIIFLKSKIAENVKDNNLEEAYILMKVLVQIQGDEEALEKIVCICDSLRKKNRYYEEEELGYIEKLIQMRNYALPYLYLSSIHFDNNEFELSLINLNLYFEKGGKEDEFIVELKNKLLFKVDYNKAKEILYDKPIEALKLFLKLLEEEEEDPLLYYYIAIAYRIIGNHEKAIYYLNESLSIESNYVEVFNELGLNHACIRDFNNALNYFKKAFEAIKTVEICTNIIMCYLELNHRDEAISYLKVAKSIDAEDEVVLQLEKILKE